jgi:hypothetical protein
MHGLLAHMGGIDEIGIFLVPAVLAIIVLRRVERKAREKEADRAASASDRR